MPLLLVLASVYTVYTVLCTMYRSDNRHLSHLNGVKSGEQLNAKLFEQILRSKTSVFDEICRDIGVLKHEQISSTALNKRHIQKDLLCFWLESVCSLMNSFSVPRLQEAMRRCDEQNEKIIESQKTIIELQAKVIQNKEEELANLKSTVQEELKTVQETVQSEIKSYSSVLSKTCSAALSEKKIQAAVKSATEREDRNRNVVIYGVEETPDEVLSEKTTEIFIEIGEKPAVKDCCRIGLKRSKVPRPVKICLNSPDVVQQVLRKARLLRTKEGYRAVYICPDRTVEERMAYKKLLEELKTKRNAEPDKFFAIRNNKVVSVSEDNRHHQDVGSGV